MLKVKEAVLGDEEIVLEYIKKLARYEKLEDQVSGTREDVINNILKSPVAKALLLFNEKGENVGFSLYFFNFSTFQIKKGLYIEDIFIDEQYRNCGYGSMLFDYYNQLAKQLDCGRIEWICLDWNQDAIDFYEKKLGATSMDGWTIRRIDLSEEEK